MRQRLLCVSFFLCGGILLVTQGSFPSDAKREIAFAEPIDALSVAVRDPSALLSVEAFDGEKWLPPESLTLENEQDPALTESNLVLFPKAITRVRFDRPIDKNDIHPITISQAPAFYQVAASSTFSTPKILTRREWGADENLRVDGNQTKPLLGNDDVDSPNDAPVHPTNQRERDCVSDQQHYPEDFERDAKRVTELNGEPLKWPQEYSKKIRLIAIHHTAVKAAGDARSGVERMRALYQYHARNRGWGDIGYHYVIDDDGQIYQGRAGGDYVIAGHAYCHNVDTLGIALMGNFNTEEPTQAQMKSLQWLLESLTKKYDIKPSGTVTYHGVTLQTIVGHRQLVSTDCPGYFVFETLDQVRRNVTSGKIDTSIRFPPPPPDAIVHTPDKRIPSVIVGTKGTFFYQQADLVGRPGGEVNFSLRFQAGAKPLNQRTSIAELGRSDPAMNVWLVSEEESMRLRNDVLLPRFLRKGESVMLNFRIQLPPDEGTYTLQIGDLTYKLKAEGRRIRAVTPVAARRVQRAITATSTDRSYYEGLSPTTTTSVVPVGSTSSSHAIRVRLVYEGPATSDSAVITTTTSTIVGNASGVSGNIFLAREGAECVASGDSGVLSRGIVKINPGNGILTVLNWKRGQSQYRGAIECRVVDGEMVLINELPLDLYMRGLGEEPDTEPYEKQRAFAIAARTYAAWYMKSDTRKFPGKPYDGNDSPATFQKYTGYLFELRNPSWIKAVESTVGKVLKKDGKIIKPPYFSSDDGRTRSPEEAKWGSFPFAEIFTSKPDPWCQGMANAGHLVGMSGCGAEGQAEEGKKGEEILQYYYPGTTITAQ